MKRFFKKSYSWLAMMVLTIMFAVSGSAQAAKAIEFSAAAMQTNSASHDGVTVTAAYWTGSQFNVYGDLDSEWGYLKVNSAIGNIVKVEFNGPSGMNTITCTNGALTSATSTFSTWEGNTDEVIFHSSDDVYVNSITVYVEEGGTATEEVALEFLPTASNLTLDGVTVNAAYWTGSQFNVYGDLDSEWGYLKVSSASGNITKVEFYGASGMNTITCTNGALTSATNAKSIWEGDTEEVIFHSSSDVYVDKVVVYINKSAAPVKDCSIDVDHFADNCKPGKVEAISKWITIYMQGTPMVTSWTGGPNCPEGVTFTTEAGEEIPVIEFNYWNTSSQIGIVLNEGISTPGVYTLHIPEGLVLFEGKKWNKEINATWTVVEPDLRPTKDVVFDFTDGTYTNDGTLSYTKDGVVFTLNENRYNATAQGFRIGTDGWVSFAAPEKATLKKIQLLQESSYGVSPDFIANVGEVSVYDKTLNWTGDDANVTLTDNYGTCYFTKAIITLAVEESEEPVVDPDEACFNAWVALVNGEFANIANEYGNEIPAQDIVGKKPIAVAVPCIEFYTNRAGLAGMEILGWQFVNGMLNTYYNTTLAEDYAYAKALLEAYNAAEVVTEVVVPSDKDKYTIKLNGTDYYFTTTEVKDNNVTTYSISATPEYFYIEPSGNGYTIKSADTDKWVGYDVISTWDFSNDEKVWTIGSLEGEPTTIYKNGSKGFGVDNRYEGAGVYTDKSGQYWVIEKFEEGGEVEPTTKWEGEIAVNKTSISSVADLEGLQITFVGAQQVEFNEYGMYIVGNEDGSELYAVWAQYPEEGYNGTYTLEGNTVTLNNFSTIECDPIPAGTTVVYLSDFSAFLCNGEDIDGDVTYFDDYAIAYEGAPAPVPFELVFRNNNVVCENGKKVEANEAGVGADFYLVNEGLTAVGKTATLYKDGNAMSFVMTLVDGTAISFLGGSSLITEPGTYLLEVPEGTYVDAAGNPSIAFYGQWVVIQKDEPTYTEPVLSAEDVSAEVAYYIYTDARGGLTVDGDQLKGTKEVGKNVDPTDVAQQFAFVNWEGNLYLYSLAAEKFIGKANRGNFTEEPVDPIYFKNAYNGTVMLYFDDSFNFNLGGSNQVTIDTWKQKDAGNSFKIMVAEKFDQTALLDKLAGPAGWNGEVLYPETAANLDDLLSYTVEFEEAKEVEASGYDVLAAVFDANGEPYAIALANGVFDVFGSISFEGSKATVNFMKISDLTAAAQSNAKAAAARIGGFIQPAGKASVVFAGKSFKVDGELVYDILQKDYELGENGVPTGIDTITTESNDSIYDLNGRRVNSVRSGLYIKNGVKVLY